MNFLVKNTVLLCGFIDLASLGNCDPFFAERTKTEVEEDTRGKPFDVKSFFETFYMENMTTTATDTWRS